MRPSSPTRRSVARALVALGAAGLLGCTSDTKKPGEGDAPPSRTPPGEPGGPAPGPGPATPGGPAPGPASPGPSGPTGGKDPRVAPVTTAARSPAGPGTSPATPGGRTNGNPPQGSPPGPGDGPGVGTSPAPTPAPAGPPTGTSELARAEARGWERGRVALVVDLLLKAKSAERGFEAALVFLPDMREGVTTALLEQAANLDGRIRERSLESLAGMARLRLVPDALRARAVETISARVRTETAPGAWSPAVAALGAIAGVDAGRDVTDALSRAVDEDAAPVVRACAEVLGDLEIRAAAPALVSAADRVRDRYAARTVIRALGRVGGGEAVDRLKRALASADAGDRESAAGALGEAGGPIAANALKSAITKLDEVPAVRSAAIAGLERMGGKSAIQALQACLTEIESRTDGPWVVIAHDVSETLARVKKR